MSPACKIKFVVTGASGFIGRSIITELLGRGCEVVGVTRNKLNLSQFGDRIRIIEADLQHISDALLAEIGDNTCLIHLAWGGLPNYSSLHHFEAELPAQYQFIKTLVENGLSSVFVSGTCFEYGMKSGKLCEEDATLPQNPYGYAKDSLRKQLQFLSKERSFNLTWGRLFYIYGEEQGERSLFSQLKRSVSEKKLCFNMSGGEQLRDYLPLSDVAKAIVSVSMLQGDFGVVNICSGNPVSVRSLVERWLVEYRWDIKLNLGFYSYPRYEPMAFWGDVQKLDKILGGGPV